MANLTTDQKFPSVVLEIWDAHTPPRPATVDGVPVWASSDETVLTVLASADGMSAVVDSVAPGTARVSVTADADLGAGMVPLVGTSEDVEVTAGAAGPAINMSLSLGAPVDK